MVPNFIRNSLILIVLIFVVIGLMIGYVKLTQVSINKDSDLALNVATDVIWPWESTQLWIDYSGAEGEEIKVDVEPGPIVFLIDTSGSMSDGNLAEAKAAILEMQRNVANSKGKPPIGVVNFANRAAIVTNLTKDTNKLQGDLANMQRNVGGGTSFIVGLNEVLRVIEDKPSSTIVMLTDGHAGESVEQLRQYYKDVWLPRAEMKGHTLYMIGIGEGGVNTATFNELSSDPSRHVLTSIDRQTIGSHFLETARRMGNVLGRNVRLDLGLSEPFWSLLIRDSIPTTEQAQSRQPLKSFDTETKQHSLPVIFKRPYQWSVDISPKIGGILSVSMDQPKLTFVDNKGSRRVVFGEDSSKVLVITPFLLLSLCLPLLLYWLYGLYCYLTRETAKPLPKVEAKTTRVVLPPDNLPLAPISKHHQTTWTPGLIIGLGASGRIALSHLKQNINDSVDDASFRPILLSLDVSQNELEREQNQNVDGCLVALDSNEVFALPPSTADLTQLVHQSFEQDDPIAALDLNIYKNMSTDVLRLDKGTSGHRILARLALLNDLRSGSDSALLIKLKSALSEWRAIHPQYSNRQIQIVANVDGGVGSGWLIDLIVLLRRLVEQDEKQGHAVEIVVTLTGKENERHDRKIGLHSPVLFKEIDRLACAGKHGFVHNLAQDTTEASLHGKVTAKPHDSIFVHPIDSRAELAAVADVCAFLLDGSRRSDVAQSLQSIQGEEVKSRLKDNSECYTKIAVHNAVYPHSFFNQLYISRLEQLVASEQVLFVGMKQDNGIEYQTKGLALKDLFHSYDIDPTTNEPCAVKKLILGQFIEATWPQDDSMVINALHRLGLSFVEASNDLLQKRDIGLYELSLICEQVTKNAQLLDEHQVGYFELQQYAEKFDRLKKQIVTWLQLFHGNGETDEQAGENRGLLFDATDRYQRTLTRLGQWTNIPSRILINSVSAIGSFKEQEVNKLDSAIAKALDEQFADGLSGWLGKPADEVAALNQRCHWQLNIPGLNDQSIGIHLILRGMKVARYNSDIEGIAQFRQDIANELTTVLEDVNRTHVLHILQLAQKQAKDQNNWIKEFALSLKGHLKGERSQLIVSLPKINHSQTELYQFRVNMSQFLKEYIAGATEIVRIHDSENTTSLGLLQAEPLLKMAIEKNTNDAINTAIFAPERQLGMLQRRLAESLGYQQVNLPSNLALALEDREGVDMFARLVMTAQVQHDEVADKWQLKDTQHWIDLTPIKGMGLADAIVFYVRQFKGRGYFEADESCLVSENDGQFVLEFLSMRYEELNQQEEV